MRRGLAAALLLALAGAVLLLAASGATWTTLVVEGRAPLPDVTARFGGADVVPGLRALGVVGLAGVPALLAVRGWGRVAVGALLAATGVLAAGLVARVLTDAGPAVSRAAGRTGEVGLVAFREGTGPALSAWPSVALLGGVLLALAGLLAMVRGRAWPALGRRYDAPRTRPVPAAPTGDKQVWEALDRGEDPTR